MSKYKNAWAAVEGFVNSATIPLNKFEKAYLSNATKIRFLK